MIIDVPKAEDFSDVGSTLLFLAWTKALDLLIALNDPLSPTTLRAPRDSRRHFFAAASIERKVIYTLILQSVEFLIKARIAQESPFLLLEKKEFARADSVERKISFAELKTIHSSELVSINNSIGRAYIGRHAEDMISKLRKDRNKIIHSIDPTLEVGFKTLILTILECFSIFVGDEPFFKKYRNYLYNSSKLAKHKLPRSYRRIDYLCISLRILFQQAMTVKRLLRRDVFAKYFGCDKTALKYFCGSCWGYLSSDEHFFQEPDTPIAKQRTVYRDKEGRYACYVCGEQSKVYPSFKCWKCKRTLIQVGNGFCLNCREITMKHT